MTQPNETTDDERRKAFGDALGGVLAVRDLTQRGLGELLGGTKQSTISAWLSGKSEPDPATVFAVEAVLELAPGQLSGLLGYLPPAAAKSAPPSFEAVVSTDPLLDDVARRSLLALYREMTTRRTTSRGGRPRKS